jgi:hypothetical protein
VKAENGKEVLAVLRNVLHVLRLFRRGSWSYHILFSLTQALRQGHCLVLADPVDHFRLHAAHSGGVMVPLERAHRLVWLPTRIASPTVSSALVTTTPSGKRLWHSRLGYIGESRLHELLTICVEGIDFPLSEKL